MSPPRLTIARWMTIVLLVGLGLAVLKYANRGIPNPAIAAKRFALLGRIDINRDSTDDRAELKRIIEDAGGVVVFDLPPPGVSPETGTISAQADWYVTDDRLPLSEAFSRRLKTPGVGPTPFERQLGQRLKEARLSRVRPMPIERLLSFVGYDQSQPSVRKP